MRHDVALGLVALGTAVTVLAAIGAVAVGRDPLDRVHYLTPITSVGAPPVLAGLVVDESWGITSGQIIVIGVLLALVGPVLGAATGRLIGQRRGVAGSDAPQ